MPNLNLLEVKEIYMVPYVIGKAINFQVPNKDADYFRTHFGEVEEFRLLREFHIKHYRRDHPDRGRLWFEAIELLQYYLLYPEKWGLDLFDRIDLKNKFLDYLSKASIVAQQTVDKKVQTEFMRLYEDFVKALPKHRAK